MTEIPWYSPTDNGRGLAKKGDIVYPVKDLQLTTDRFVNNVPPRLLIDTFCHLVVHQYTLELRIMPNLPLPEVS